MRLYNPSNRTEEETISALTFANRALCKDDIVSFDNSNLVQEPMIKNYEKVESDDDGSKLREALDKGPVVIAF